MPWTPVVASEQNGACKISVWGSLFAAKMAACMFALMALIVQFFILN
jgi:hypothetical protein